MQGWAKVYIRLYMHLPQKLAPILELQISVVNSCIKVQQRPTLDQVSITGGMGSCLPHHLGAAGGLICSAMGSTWTPRPFWPLKMNGGRQEPFLPSTHFSDTLLSQSKSGTCHTYQYKRRPLGICTCNMATRPVDKVCESITCSLA